MRLRRAALIAAGIALAVLLPANAAGAAVATGVPKDCTVQPGRFQVIYNPGLSHTVLVTSPAILCSATSTYTIFVTYTLNRWYGPAVGFKPEDIYSGKAWNQAIALNDPLDCKIPGALMSLTAVYKFNKRGVGLVAKATYAGRTTALCSR